MASHEENSGPVHTQSTQQPGSTSNVETNLPNPYFLSYTAIARNEKLTVMV